MRERCPGQDRHHRPTVGVGLYHDPEVVTKPDVVAVFPDPRPELGPDHIAERSLIIPSAWRAYLPRRRFSVGQTSAR